MQLRTLHIICSDNEAAKKVKKIFKGCKSVIESWENKNAESVSIYLLVSDQDQKLFDSLQSLSEKQESVRMIVQTVDASFPKNFRDKKQEQEKNSPVFFDIISREEMLEIVKQRSRLNGSYLSLIIISSIVATIALIKDNVAMLIGAMVLTPLLGPNLALALSTATANTMLVKRAVLSGGIGYILTFIVAAFTGFVVGKAAGDDITPMLIGYGFESIPIAVCAGAAATILLLQGTLSSLIGVMVAVAFLPPIAMTGLALSSGDYSNSIDAFMLFAINLASFNLAAKTVLLTAGIRPRKSSENGDFYRSIVIYLVGWLAAIMLVSMGLYFKG